MQLQTHPFKTSPVWESLVVSYEENVKTMLENSASLEQQVCKDLVYLPMWTGRGVLAT